MIIGVPKETKQNEHRVAVTAAGAAVLTRKGHRVLVENSAGQGSGIADEEYAAAGADLVSTADAWGAELVVKVKEPTPAEFAFLREGLTLFTYLHLAADRPLTERLIESRTTAIAYETVAQPDGSLPLLTPMSEVAGRLAPQVGASFLERPNGGRGVLLGGVPGVPPGSVVIIGGGVVGINAAKIAVGFGAQVTIIEVSHRRLEYLDDIFRGRAITVMSNEANIRAAVQHADLLIGAVLIPGAKAPRLVTRDMLATMKEASVIVDVAVDQGGCVETARPTTHADPTFVVDGVVHYCVANMPGAVPRTSTFALSGQTLPYVERLAAGPLEALRADRGLLSGLNVYAGKVTFPGVAQAFGFEAVAAEAAVG
jgi:alanine dehydrogenase